MVGASLLVLLLCYLSLVSGAFENEEIFRRFDPLKGLYLDTFETPLEGRRCSVYLISKRALFLEGCSAQASSYVARLQYAFNGKKVERVVELHNGTYLEIPKLKTFYRHEEVPSLTITADNDDMGPAFKKVIVFHVFAESGWRAPREEYLDPLLGPDLSSKNVLIMNARRLFIFYLRYDPHEYNCSEAFFWVGKGDKGPNRSGMKIPDEHGSLEPLKTYNGEIFSLIFPNKEDENEPYTVYDFDYFGIWCPKGNQSHGYVDIPPQYSFYRLMVPPPNYFDKFHFEGDPVFCQPEDTFSPTLSFNETESEQCIGAASNLGFSLRLVLLVLSLCAIK